MLPYHLWLELELSYVASSWCPSSKTDRVSAMMASMMAVVHVHVVLCTAVRSCGSCGVRTVLRTQCTLLRAVSPFSCRRISFSFCLLHSSSIHLLLSHLFSIETVFNHRGSHASDNRQLPDDRCACRSCIALSAWPIDSPLLPHLKS